MATTRMVLDYGKVTLLPGSADYVAYAARFTRGKEGNIENVDVLYRALLRQGHGSPFEFTVLTFQVKAPLFVARQWMRHRMGSYMERSRRVVKDMPQFYTPTDMSNGARQEYVEACQDALITYGRAILSGVRPEQARGVLPQAMYTEFLWQVNARSLMNWLTQRRVPEAQWEIRQYADVVLALWQEAMPELAAAWQEIGGRP